MRTRLSKVPFSKLPFPKGPNLETFSISLGHFQSHLTISISLEHFNLGLQNSPTKNIGVWWVALA